MHMLRWLFAVLMVVIIPIRSWGQNIDNNNIVIDISAINNPDFRYCLLSSVTNDDNIIYTIDEENYCLLLSSSGSMDDYQFKAYYNELFSQAQTEFGDYLVAEK